MFSTTALSLIGLTLLTSLPLTQADWTISTDKFIPSTGQLNPNASADVSDQVYAKLKTARGYVDRLNTLRAQNNTDLFKFNFNPAVAGVTASKGSGGLAVLADSTTAPVLVGTGVAFALGFLEPCGEWRSINLSGSETVLTCLLITRNQRTSLPSFWYSYV